MAGLCEGSNEPAGSLKAIYTKNSVGLVGCIEEVAHNAIAVYWNPLESTAKLQNEVGVNDRDIERLQSGFSPTKKKRKYLNTDARISRIVERYENYKNSGDVVGYLLAIGHNIAGNF
ncbi:hypothetical protein ANN_10389 [Periplaneta americana]|uniref:Per a allergen n=1 Tax=Periplaneta americana TaxID=6978 RepID=A0ABQ8TPY5_PERAM|nr:hypothetical protein ANN_10389 [Periplaneta americana]